MKQSSPELAATELRRARWARNGRYRFTIEFAATQCVCGATRTRTAACADCGTHPERHDTDVGLQRRQRLSGRALGVLMAKARGTSGNQQLSSSDAFNSLAEVMPPFLAALQQFATSNTDPGDQVVETCERAVELRDQLASTPKLRPWLFARGEADSIAHGLIQTMSSFVLATSASTPLEAQELGVRAQRELDELGEVGDRVADLFERMSVINEGGDITGMLSACAADAYLSLGSGTLAEIEESASAQLAQILGREPGAGQGLAYMHHDLWVSLLGDRAKFHSSIAHFDRLIGRRPQNFAALLERPQVVADLQEGMLQLADQLQQTMVTLENVRTDRQEVRAAIQLMHALYEGPGRRFAAFALELVGKGTFEALMDEDGAHVVGMAQDDKSCRHSFYGFEKSFRVAYAHLDFVPTDGGIVVRRRGGSADSWTEDEVLDRLLATNECIVALALVVGMRAEDLGFDIHPPAALEALGLDDSNLVSIVLSWAGCTDIDVQIVNNEPVVRFAAERLTMSTLAVISRGFEWADHARVEVSNSVGTTDTWNLDLAGFRSSSKSDDEFEKQALLLLALWRSTKNGHSARTKETLMHWAACRTVALLEPGDLPPTMRELTQIVQFATTIGEPGLATAVKRVKAFFRLSVLGHGDDITRADVLGINEYILAEPPDIDELI